MNQRTTAEPVQAGPTRETAARGPKSAMARAVARSAWGGNQARLRFLASPPATDSLLQRKLTLGASNDPLAMEGSGFLHMPEMAIADSPAVAEHADKRSGSPSIDSGLHFGTDLAGTQPADSERAALPEFLRQLYGPATVEDGMSEQEKRARGVALFSAAQIEISLGDALKSLHDSRLASKDSATDAASDAKRTIRKRVQKEKDKIEQTWDAQDIATKSAILAEYQSLEDGFAARRSDAEQRVEISTTGVNTLFGEHQSNLDKAAVEGGADCEKAHKDNRNQIMFSFYDTENEVSRIALAIREGFGRSERDDAMREGVRWVEHRINHEMDDRLEDAYVAIDDFFLKQPSTAPEFADLPEGMRPKVSMQSIIVGSSKKVQRGFDSHKQEVLDQVQQTGPMALDSLTSVYAGESSHLDKLQVSAPDQLAKLRDASFDRIDRLGQSAYDQIDDTLGKTLKALWAAEASVRRRLEPLGKKAIALLRTGVPPEEQESSDVAADLSRYFQSSVDLAAESMGDGASRATRSFVHTAARTETDLAAESGQGAKYVTQFSLEVSDEIDGLQKQRIRQMRSGSDELTQVLDDFDQKFIDHFASMVQDFRTQIQNTIEAMNAKIAEAMQETKGKNQESLKTVEAAMRGEAKDRGWKFDHPVRHALWVGLQSGWAAIKTTFNVIKSVITVILIAFAATLALVLLGVELAIAEAIVAVAGLGYIAYQAIESYHARKSKGQSEVDAIFGSVGDVTGVSEIYHGFTDEYLTLPERTAKITGGVENVVLLTYGERINEGIGKLARENAPWLEEPPRPTSPSAASALEAPSAPGGRLAEGTSGDANAAWEPPSIKQELAEWNASQTPSGNAGNPARPPAPAPAASPAPLLAPSDTPVDTAAGATAPKANQATPVQLPVIDPPRAANDNAVAPQSDMLAAPDTASQEAAQRQLDPKSPTTEKPDVPSADEDLSPDDPRLKEQDVQDIRPRIAEREAARQAQQIAEDVVPQNNNVEIEQANEETGQAIKASAEGGGGGGRVKPAAGYRKSSGPAGGRSTGSSGGSSTNAPIESGSRQSNVDSTTPQPAAASPTAIEPAARPVLESGYRSTPKALAQRLRLAGLSEGEIVSFGGEDASELSADAAKRAGRLGEHFSADDMKSLGAFLEESGLVIDDTLANTFIESVPPGELRGVLKSIDIAEARRAETGVGIEADPDSGVNIDESRIKKEPLFPGKTEIPLWRQAEIDLGPALDSNFGPGWEPSTRFRPELAGEGELLGSTVPEYFREGSQGQRPQAFEVKRFNLDEMGIGRDGKTTAAPSKATVEALLRAKLQLASRKWNLPKGTEQNIVFNTTGQGVTDVAAVGEAITGLLKNNRVAYDNVYVQNGGTLTPVGSFESPQPASPPALDTAPESAPPAEPSKTPTFERPHTPADPGASIKMLSKGEIKELQRSGFDVHEEKGEGRVSQSDLYKDSERNIWVKNKGGRGEAEFTGWKLTNLKR